MSVTSNKPKLRLKKVYWKDVRDKVSKLQPKFAKLVDELDPGKNFPLYIATYRYGDLIVDDGLFNLPTEEGGLIPITSPDLPSDIHEDLGMGKYRIAPGIVLNKAMELFVKPGNRILPWVYYTSKNIFGLWGYLDADFLKNKLHPHPSKIFNISAGVRSVFLLPSIGDMTYHTNFERQLRCRFQRARDLTDHHRLFVDLTKHEEIKSNWEMRVLYFSKSWIESLNGQDKSWMWLRLFLLNFAWSKTGYWRNVQHYNLAYSWAQANRDMKLNPYLVDTAKHLLNIAAGYVPGFAPAVNDEVAPVSTLQKIFLEIYRVKYHPTIMCPKFFCKEWDSVARKKTWSPIYYSLNFPTTLEFSPPSQKYALMLQSLRDLKQIVRVFGEEICTGKIKLEDTPLRTAFERADFSLFHIQPDKFYDIRPTEDMPREDYRLMNNLAYTDGEAYDSKPFAFAGPFLRGCIRVSLKKNNKKSNKIN